MDLVVGSTGMVGGRVAHGLAAAGRRVRALVRNPEGRPEADRLREAGIEVASGDLTRPDTLRAACAGVDVVVCTATSMPHATDDGLRRVDRDGVRSLVEAAEEAGADTFVYVSYSGNLKRPSPLQEAKRGTEERLLASPLRAVILRPSIFMDVWLSPHLGFDPVGGRVVVYGPGDRPVSYISAADVAEFAVRTATGEAEGDLVLELGGPEPLSQLQVVEIFERTVGREIEREHVPLEALRQRHASTDPLERTFGALGLGYADGDPIPDAPVTARAYGISLRSVEAYAREFPAVGAAPA